MPMNLKARKARPPRTRSPSLSRNVWRRFSSPVIWDCVWENKTVGSHQGITWCNLDTISIMGLVRGIMELGRAGRGISWCVPVEQCSKRQHGFQLSFWKKTILCGANSPAAYQARHIYRHTWHFICRKQASRRKCYWPQKCPEKSRSCVPSPTS